VEGLQTRSRGGRLTSRRHAHQRRTRTPPRWTQLLPSTKRKASGSSPTPPPEDGRHRVRVASGPYPPGSSRCDLDGRKRRFLTYAFPPRSPGPHHLAVLTRPGFVGAACHPNPGISQARLPPASQSCCDRTTVEVSHLHSINVHFTAHSFAITIDLAAKPLGAIQ
jgi:hypothetical protein